MSANTEQEIVTTIYPDDNTKTIFNFITDVATEWGSTEEYVKNILKTSNPDITDWSF